MNLPNVISNTEDQNEPVIPYDKVVISDDSADENKSERLLITEDGFKDITPQVMRSRRKASKTRFWLYFLYLKKS